MTVGVKHLAVILALLASVSAKSQYAEGLRLSTENIEQVRKKLITYNKVKKVGTIFAISGGVLTLSGVVLISQGNMQGNDEFPYGLFGATALGVGLPFLTSGIILSAIGSKKSAEYSKKLATLSMSYLDNGAMLKVSLNF